MSSIIIRLIIFIVAYRFVRTSDDEHQLIHYLFSEQGYNPLVRPTEHSNQTVVVSFGLLLVQLIHVFEKEQVMKTNTWLHMKWHDSQLRWNPTRYGGIDKINVPFSHVWTPDVVLFNNADGNYEVTFKSKVVLMHTGEVHWVPPAIYKSSCRIDVKYFPFDTQECEMRFASWTYNAHEVMFAHYVEEYEIKTKLSKLLPQQASSITSDELYKDDYLESGTWDVISIPSQFVYYHSNKTSSKSDSIEVVFLIKMSRKTLYYTVNLIVPTALMSILICIVFCLPTAAGEKMTLCMSILLALNLFQLLVTKILPPTSVVVPLIAKYLLFTFTLNILVIINTVVITNFYYRTPMIHTMPYWLRRFFLEILPKFLCMKSPKLKANLPSIFLENSIINRTKRRKSNVSTISYLNNKRRTSTILIGSREIHEKETRKQKFLHFENQRKLIPVHPHRRLQIEIMRNEIRQALDHIRYIGQHCAHQTLIESVRDEWKFIATAIDRLQFIVFLTATFIGSFALLFQVPDLFHFYKNNSQELVRFSNPNVTIHETIRT